MFFNNIATFEKYVPEGFCSYWLKQSVVKYSSNITSYHELYSKLSDHECTPDMNGLKSRYTFLYLYVLSAVCDTYGSGQFLGTVRVLLVILFVRKGIRPGACEKPAISHEAGAECDIAGWTQTPGRIPFYKEGNESIISPPPPTDILVLLAMDKFHNGT